MKVADLPSDKRSVFYAAYYKAKGQKKSQVRCLMAGYLALEKYESNQGTLKVKLKKMERREDDKRLVFGFFSIVEMQGQPVVDLQGDVIFEKDLEEAVYKYVKNSRMGDEKHDSRCKATLVESMLFTKEKQKALGIDLGFSGWWGGFHVHDDKMWEKIKNGEYESFSIGGAGKYEQYG